MKISIHSTKKWPRYSPDAGIAHLPLTHVKALYGQFKPRCHLIEVSKPFACSFKPVSIK